MSGRVLRFKSSLPFHLESKLVNRYGYAIQQRKPGEYIEFVLSPKPETNVVQLSIPIVATRQTELLRRCDNIVEFFPDPYNSARAVRTRLHNMSQTLCASERQFVRDFMDDNFPLVDTGL
jgi:hypothetical protein